MQVYLPIAEMSVDALLLLGIGFGVGWLSGLFGVGGGFLLTPLLILIGIPSPVAVASGANQTIGASVSGLIAQWRRGNVDVRMGAVLLAGGFIGSALGVQLFALLRQLGQVDLAVLNHADRRPAVDTGQTLAQGIKGGVIHQIALAHQ